MSNVNEDSNANSLLLAFAIAPWPFAIISGLIQFITGDGSSAIGALGMFGILGYLPATAGTLLFISGKLANIKVTFIYFTLMGAFLGLIFQLLFTPNALWLGALGGTINASVFYIVVGARFEIPE